MKNIIKFIVIGLLGATAMAMAADIPVTDIVTRAKSMPDGSRSVNVPSSVMAAIDKQTESKYGQGVGFVNDGIEAANRAARASASSSSSSSGNGAIKWDKVKIIYKGRGYVGTADWEYWDVECGGSHAGQISKHINSDEWQADYGRFDSQMEAAAELAKDEYSCTH